MYLGCINCGRIFSKDEPGSAIIVQPLTGQPICAYCPNCYAEGNDWGLIIRRAKAWLAARQPPDMVWTWRMKT